MEDTNLPDEERCASCGAPVPEGRMICFCCEKGIHAMGEVIRVPNKEGVCNKRRKKRGERDANQDG